MIFNIGLFNKNKIPDIIIDKNSLILIFLFTIGQAIESETTLGEFEFVLY